MSLNKGLQPIPFDIWKRQFPLGSTYTVREREACEECGGTGKVGWGYWEDDECEECSGKKYQYVYNTYRYIVFEGAELTEDELESEYYLISEKINYFNYMEILKRQLMEYKNETIAS